MKTIKQIYAQVPKWLKPSKEQIKAGRVVVKAFVKGVVIAGSGALTMKLGGGPEVALAVSGIAHAVIKWIDPNDPSLGINKEPA